jgi:translation elongation factor EF-1beta
MIVYADKRADFHRHSRSVELRLTKTRNTLRSNPNVVKRLLARTELDFLLIEAKNLHFGAQVIDLSVMVNKLEKTVDTIQEEIAANEQHIESLAQRQRRSSAERLQREAESLVQKTLGAPKRKGVTLMDDFDYPILFVMFENVSAQDTIHPVYTIWNTDKALSSSFTRTPYAFLDWTPITKMATPSVAVNSILRTDGFRS